MTKKPAPCMQIAEDLLAAAIGEASERARRRVDRHVAGCGPCRREFQGYRDLDRTVSGLKDELIPGVDLTGARERLEIRLADLRGRMFTYRIFPSPLGHILIARSDVKGNPKFPTCGNRKFLTLVVMPQALPHGLAQPSTSL